MNAVADDGNPMAVFEGETDDANDFLYGPKASGAWGTGRSLVGVVKVFHGTDPNVARPNAPVVYWIGSADPVNALDEDWYKSS